jgi:hypothetical protein
MIPFMARKKGRGSADQLAVVKSAAWAWYLRGSGSEGKQMPEFDVMRTRRAPRPSVFKLEAMRIAEEAVEEEGSQTPSSIHTDNSLLDSYEIASISRSLDCLIESSVSNSHRKYLIGGYHDPQAENMTPEGTHHAIEVKKKKKKMRGFWVRHAAVTCGTSREDVADASAFRDIRQPQKLAPAARLATGRSRGTHAR